jgi:hypothetical protein
MPKNIGAEPVTEVERLLADLDIHLKRTKRSSLIRNSSPHDRDLLRPGVLDTLRILEEIYDPRQIKPDRLLKEY